MTTKMTFKTAVVESPERQPRQFSARMEGKRSSGGGGRQRSLSFKYLSSKFLGLKFLSFNLGF